MGWPPGSLAAIAGVAVVIAAWHPAVKASYHPPVEAGTSFPIPPELAPGEILDAAEIDDSGRPL